MKLAVRAARKLYVLCSSQDNGKTWAVAEPETTFVSKKEFNDWYFEYLIRTHIEDWRAGYMFRSRNFKRENEPEVLKPNSIYSLRKINSLAEL
jgi:hypothetical protein